MGDVSSNVAVGNESVSSPIVCMRPSRCARSLWSCVRSAVSFTLSIDSPPTVSRLCGRSGLPVTPVASAIVPEGNGRSLAGQVALVTGAARGIGFATARRLAEQGASVALLDRDAAAVEDAGNRLEADGHHVGW